jgi:hypothetical protein
MNEHLLQYIWQHRFYDARHLKTEDQQNVLVLHQGQINHHQGPDFLNARLRLNEIVFFGSVEIHIKTSDWERHRHTGDPHYKNVILHVVWEHDLDIHLSVPVLSLKGRIAQTLLQHYHQFFNKTITIPCAQHLRSIADLVMIQWKERLIVERLNHQSQKIQSLMDAAGQNEEAVFWCMIFRNIGMPVNADAFESIFKSLPFYLLLRSGQRIQVAEAFLLGQAKLLDDEFEDDYLKMIQKEYRHLQKKYKLLAPDILMSHLRMRPAHFPAIRLAQIAMLVHQHPDLFSKMMQANSTTQMLKILMVKANDFWHYHYTVKNISGFKEKKVGRQMAERILVNTVLPFHYRRAFKNKNQQQLMEVLDLYAALQPEQNNILNKWSSLGVKIKNASDAQALLHLTKHYCMQKLCLKCNIGNFIMAKP